MSIAGAKVFLSYKRGHVASEELLHKVEAQLIERGYQVLLDEDLQGGDRWPPRLYEWLLGCAAAVVFVSPEARESDWCQREWHVLAARAETGGARVVPVCIGVERGELGPLGNFQSIEAGPDAVERVMQALAGVAPWEVVSQDYLALHRAWNEYQFEKEPVLGRESFALARIYVETECGVLRWCQISGAGRAGCDPFQEAQGGREPLVDAVMRFVLDPTFRDAIVVQGPAGAGKSAFTLRLSQELESLGLHAVRIRFRDMRLSVHEHVERMLADAVRVGPESEQQPAPGSELFDEARLRDTVRIGEAHLCKWVFILDGWDEVSLAGSAGYQAQLRTWLPRIREFFKRAGPQVRVVITGRPSAELRESGFLYPDTPVLTLRPMRPDQLQWLGEQIEASASWSDLAGCQSIFSKYTQWFEKRDPSGVEMVGLPLLALLTFRTLSDWEGDVEALVSSPTALYCALIDQTVAHSGKGISEGLQGTVQRGGASLRHLLRRTAAMISLFWTERISFEELQARLEDSDDLQEWVSSATQGNPLYELVVNFYFKGGHPDFGCEFLHKSFREYLFAEAIVEELERVIQGHEGPLEAPTLPYWKDFEPGTLWHSASRALSRLFAASLLTPEVRRHLFWLLERAVEQHPRRWIVLRDLLADVYAWWAEGAHLRLQPVRERGQIVWGPPYVGELAKWVLPFRDSTAEPQRTATIDGNLGYALIQLTAWVHSLLRATEHEGRLRRPYQRLTSSDSPTGQGSRGTIRFCPGNGYFRQIVARWETVVMPFAPEYVLPDVWLEGEELPGGNLMRADLTRANLVRVGFAGANLAGACLAGAQLAGADLTAADLSLADLRGAQLNGALLPRVLFRSTDLKGADLSASTLSGAILSDCSLIETRLSAAILVGVAFYGCDLFGVMFSRADLTGARFRLPALRNCDFSESILNDADLSGSTIVETDFSRSHLGGARISAAVIQSCRFSHATLIEADLSHSTFAECDFFQATLDGANFKKAEFHQTHLAGATAVGVDFSQVVLSNTSMPNSPDPDDVDGSTAEG